MKNKEKSIEHIPKADGMKYMKKTKVGLPLYLFSLGMLLIIMLAMNAQVAIAETNVSACGTLSTENEVYTLNESISNATTCLNVQANNVTIDCKGYTITYSTSNAGYGLLSNGYNYTTIRDCIVSDGGTALSSHGILFNKSSFGTINNNTVTTSDNSESGIFLNSNSNNNTISNNNVTTNGDYSGFGIEIYSSSKNNTIINNTVYITGAHSSGGIEMNTGSDNNIIKNNSIRTKLSGEGIHIDSSTNNVLTENKAETNASRSYGLEGSSASHFNNTIDSTNLAKGLPVNYTYNEENLIFENISSGQYGQFIVAWSRNITITNSNFSYDSISLYAVNTSTISNNRINTTIPSGFGSTGIYAYSSKINSIINNQITTTRNSAYAIYLYSSSNFTISNNTIRTSGIAGDGIRTYLGANSTITNNNITIDASHLSIGISLILHSNSNVSNNTITILGNHNGILVYLNSNNNTFAYNKITSESPSYGFIIDSSTNNTLISNEVNTSNSLSYMIDGTTSSHFNNTIDSTNNAEGLPVNLTCFQDNLAFNNTNFSQYGQVSFCWCKNITITNSNFSYDSLSLFYTNTSTIANNKINTSTSFGVLLQPSSSYNNLSNNIITTSTNNGYGIYLNDGSTNNIMNNNSITTSGGDASAIYMRTNSNYNNATNNIINTTAGGEGIYILTSSYDNANNNTIYTKGQNAYGIHLSSSINCNANNNTITTLDNNAFGIFLASSSGSNMSNNTITITAPNYASGIRFDSSSSNRANNNKIRILGTTNGFYLRVNSDNNIISNTTIISSAINAQGIYLESSTNNNSFSLMNITSNGTNANGIYIYGATNNFTMTDSKVNASGSSAKELFINETSNGGIWNFTNVSRSNGDPINITWSTGANGTLNMHWYLDAYAHSGSLALENANVTSYNNQSALAFSELTASNGRINRKTLLEYTRNATSGTDYTYSSPYNLSVTLDTYQSYYNSSINLSNNQLMDIDLAQIINGCGDLNITNATYILNQSVSSLDTCFNVTANNVTLDCQGYNINYSTDGGSDEYGVKSLSYNFTTIRNCSITEGPIVGSYNHPIYLYRSSNGTAFNNTITTISNNTYGIYLYSSSYNNNINNTIDYSGGFSSAIYIYSNSNNNSITNNIINGTGFHSIRLYTSMNNSITDNIITSDSSGSGMSGIYLYSSLNNNINNNTITNFGSQGYGIHLDSSSDNNNVNNNTVTNPYRFGIILESSTNNTLRDNKANTSQANSYGLYGTTSSHYNNSIDLSNLAEGKPVNYTYNADNLIINNTNFTQYGQVIFGWSRNITITNSNFSYDALNLFNTNISTITNNNINTSTGYGILSYYNSNYNNISNNTVTTSGITGVGIYLFSSVSNNNINNNNITTNNTYAYGIQLYSCSNNNNTNNIITTAGTYAYGIQLNSGSNNNNLNNTIRTNGPGGYGIYLSSSSNNNATNNIINTTGGSGHGIYLRGSSDNNNINNNTIKVSNSNSYGIWLRGGPENNDINNNTITTIGSGSYGIYLLLTTNNNTFSKMDVKTNGTDAYAFYLEDANHSFTITDSILNASKPGVQELYVKSNVTGGTWNFTNVTRANGNSINITWSTGANGTLNMHWYLDAYAHSGSLALENANVTSYNNQSALAFTELTASNGRINRKTLLEYKRNATSGTDYTWYSPYNMTVTKTGYSSYYNQSINLSNNLDMDITLALTMYDCGDLDMENETYYLGNDVSSPDTCFNVTANNVTLDCQGYNINYSTDGGDDEYGVKSLSYNFTTIRNCSITEGLESGSYDHPIYFYRSSNGTIFNNTLTTIGNFSYGIYLYSSSNNNNATNNTITTTNDYGYGIYLLSSSSNNIIKNNDITTSGGGGYGIRLNSYSSNNNINNNTITTTSNSGFGIHLESNSNNNNINNNTITTNGNFGYGINLDSSTNNNITNNTVATSGFLAYGIRLEDSTNNTLTYNKANTSLTNSYVLEGTNYSHYNNSIDISNHAEGMPVNYTYNASNLPFDNVNFTQYGQVIFGWSRNITITNSNFSYDSLNLFSTNISTITNNNINTSTGYGIWLLTNSNNSNISNNTITTSGERCNAVFIQSSTKSSIDNNTITTSGEIGYGIYLDSSSNINATNNIINATGPTGRGIVASSATNCKISNNTITTSNTWGVGVYLSTDCTSNSINNNSIRTSGGYLGMGIYLQTRSDSNNVTDNIINTLSSKGYGINLESNANNNNISKNTITTEGGHGYGIQIRLGSSNNTMTNNTITTSGLGGYGIYLLSSSNNNTFSKMNVKTNGTTGYALYLDDENHNFTITDSTLNASKSGVQDLFVNETVTGGEWNFTNVTRADGNQITTNWSTGANGTLNMHWYLDVYVRNSTAGLAGANVTSYNNRTSLAFSELTQSNGRINTKTLIEYTRNATSGTDYTWSSPYNMTVTKSTYYPYYNQSINLSNNVAMDITLSGLTLIAPVNASNFNSSTVGFNASSKVNLSYCGLSIDNAPNLTMTLNSSLTGANYTQTGLAEGNHNFTITCNDTYNNFLTTDLTWFLIDTIYPTLNVTSPINMAHYDSQTVLINVSSSEEGTGSIVNDIDRSLILYMRMDDRNGTTVYDSSSYKNNGTTSGATYSTAGKYGGAYNFSNSHIVIPYSSGSGFHITNNRITISAWVYMTQDNEYPTVLDSAGAVEGQWPYLFEFSETGRKITLYMTGVPNVWDSDADTTVPLNTWTHIAATYNGSYIQYYFNGKPDGSFPRTGNMHLCNHSIYIGRRHEGLYPFYGKLDEVMVYNRSLSTDEMRSLYNATKEQFNITLTGESHTLTKYTQDLGGNLASSGLITFDTDVTPPTIYFTGITPVDWANLTVNHAFTNVSSNDTGKEHSTFADWNNSIVLWMRMDDRKNDTYIYDNSSYGNNGTVYGSPGYTPAGKRGEAVEIDGTGDYIATADIDADYITITAWVKAADSNTYGYIVTKNYDVTSVPYSLNVGGNSVPSSINGMAFYSSGSWKNSGITTDVRADKQWHFIAGTYNGTTLMYYVDGALDGSSTEGSGVLPKNNNAVDIGRYATDDQYFNGSIDDVMIFNRALNASEILALYNATPYQYYRNFTSLEDGNYTYKAYAQDMAGNVNTTETRNLNIYYACSCHIDMDWTVAENCLLTNLRCDMPDYKITCLDTGSLAMTNSTINAEKAITPINHGCIFADNSSKLTIKT